MSEENETIDFADRFVDEWIDQKGFRAGVPEAMRPFIRILRIAARLEGTLKNHCEVEGITTAQFQALSALRRHAPRALSAKDIMVETVLTSGSVTSMVDQLIRRKLVERALHPVDRRQVQIKLTDKGQGVIERTLKLRSQELSKYAKLYTNKELNMLSDLLRRISLVVDRE